MAKSYETPEELRALAAMLRKSAEETTLPEYAEKLNRAAGELENAADRRTRLESKFSSIGSV